MRRLLLLSGLLLPACVAPATDADIIRAERRRDFERYVEQLETARTAQGPAFPPDSLARLGSLFLGGFDGGRTDTAYAHRLLRAARAQGSGEASFTLAIHGRGHARRTLMWEAVERGHAYAGWLASPYVVGNRPDSLVLMARAMRARHADAGARLVEAELVPLDSLAAHGNPVSDSVRTALRAQGLWDGPYYRPTR